MFFFIKTLLGGPVLIFFLLRCGQDAVGCFIRKNIQKGILLLIALINQNYNPLGQRSVSTGLKLKFPGLDDPPLVTIERGCTSETDDNLYKCETSEDGSRLEAPLDLFLNNIIFITMKGLATVRVLVATVTGRAQTTLLAMSVIPLMALSAMLSIREKR